MNDMSHISTRISRGGRVVIPAEFRRTLGLKEGDEVVLSLKDGEIRITTRLTELRRAQGIIDKYVTDPESCWSDELIAERRAEAENE